MQTPTQVSHNDVSSRRVLIIEDNRDAREMFRIMLELSGHEVLEAEEGLSGLEMLKSKRPDVAVIDVGLPGLNGYEVARRFRAEPDSGAVMLVALTGYGTPEAQEQSRKSGFNYHLIKPVNGEALEEIMREAASARVGAGVGAPPETTAAMTVPQAGVAGSLR
jgi:CheY-like chemotaxis protein